VKLLDYLGDLGGFEAIIIALLGFFANYLSDKLYIPSISSDLYIEKKRKSVIKAEKSQTKKLKSLDKINSLFEKISFHWWESLCYPIFSFCCTSCCQGKRLTLM